MGIFSFWGERVQQWTTTKSQHNDKHSNREPTRRNRGSGYFCKYISRLEQRKLHDDDSRSSVSVYSNLQRAWGHKPNRDPENNRGYQRNGYYKYLYPVIGLLIASPVSAADVGGVSATANPIANSSGSVTNQAIQVLQGPYITNTYGGGISCQGPTMNFTPYITHARNDKEPFETYYMEPQYDARDFEGRVVEVTKTVKNWPWESWYDNRTYTDATGNEVRAYEDGADMTIRVMEVQGDGVPDNPGSVLWQKPVRTGMTRNYSTNIGFSATMSFPLDGGLQERCKQAADTQIQLQSQLVANKRLDFEIARLKNCGQLMKDGIMFHPKSPYFKICADVVVMNKNAIAPHAHSIPRPTSSVVEQSAVPSQPGSSDAALLGAPLQTGAGSSFPVRSQPSSGLSSQQVSPLLTRDQQEVLQAVPKTLPQRR